MVVMAISRRFGDPAHGSRHVDNHSLHPLYYFNNFILPHPVTAGQRSKPTACSSSDGAAVQLDLCAALERSSATAAAQNAELNTMCDMNGPHAGRVVLITGAGGGVGRGYALL